MTDAAIAPWYEVNGRTLELDKKPWPAHSGNWSMDLNGSPDASGSNSIAQSLNLTVGQEYLLTVWVNKNNLCGPGIKTGYVAATGSAQAPFSVSVDAWEPIQYTFVASQVSTVVTIASTTLGGCGPVIDDIKLVATGRTLYPTCADSGLTINPSSIQLSASSFYTQFNVSLNYRPAYNNIDVFLNAPGFKFSEPKLTFTRENWQTVSFYFHGNTFLHQLLIN